LLNNLRFSPMTQFSIQWILSLNQLSQKWGQVQVEHLTPTPRLNIIPG
jgi:hypothetical protein